MSICSVLFVVLLIRFLFFNFSDRNERGVTKRFTRYSLVGEWCFCHLLCTGLWICFLIFCSTSFNVCWCISKPKNCGSKFMKLTWQLNKKTVIHVISACAPTMDTEEIEKETFYSDYTYLLATHWIKNGCLFWATSIFV